MVDCRSNMEVMFDEDSKLVDDKQEGCVVCKCWVIGLNGSLERPVESHEKMVKRS